MFVIFVELVLLATDVADVLSEAFVSEMGANCCELTLVEPDSCVPRCALADDTEAVDFLVAETNLAFVDDCDASSTLKCLVAVPERLLACEC